MNSPLETQKTIEAELKDIYELILCTTTIYVVNKKNWIRIFVIVDALNHSSLSAPTHYSPIFHLEFLFF
jgi:hypothetical protein